MDAPLEESPKGLLMFCPDEDISLDPVIESDTTARTKPADFWWSTCRAIFAWKRSNQLLRRMIWAEG